MKKLQATALSKYGRRPDLDSLIDSVRTMETAIIESVNGIIDIVSTIQTTTSEQADQLTRLTEELKKLKKKVATD